MRDLIRDLLDAAREDVNRSRMLYVDNREALVASAVIKMDAAVELAKAYERIKQMRESRRERYLLRSAIPRVEFNRGPF